MWIHSFRIIRIPLPFQPRITRYCHDGLLVSLRKVLHPTVTIFLSF